MLKSPAPSSRKASNSRSPSPSKKSSRRTNNLKMKRTVRAALSKSPSTAKPSSKNLSVKPLKKVAARVNKASSKAAAPDKGVTLSDNSKKRAAKEDSPRKKHRSSFKPDSPLSTLSTAASSPSIASLSSPDSMTSTASTRARDSKASAAIKKLNLTSDTSVSWLTANWANSEDIYKVFLTKYDADREEFLELPYENQVKEALHAIAPKDMHQLHTIWSMQLGLLPVMATEFNSRQKAEKKLLTLLLNYKNQLHLKWKRYAYI